VGGVSNDEAQTIGAFVAQPILRRMLALLESPKRRPDLVAMLDHFDGFDPKWILDLSPGDQSPEAIAQKLISLGAAKDCWAISSDPGLDRQRLSLRSALDSVVGSGFGTLLICRPGRLAFYEGEEPGARTILHR